MTSTLEIADQVVPDEPTGASDQDAFHFASHTKPLALES
jgi:hypothetical protein